MPEKRNNEKNESGLFIGNGDDKDFSNFGRIVLYLVDQEWFLPFVKTWVLYANEETDDMAAYFKKNWEKHEGI